MTEPQAIPWKRLVVEATAIVGSILLAFAIDAWWDERLERIDERDQLARLHIEFTENLERISVRTDSYIRLGEASREIFELIEVAQSRGASDIDVPARTLIRMLFAPTFEADMPVLDGLIKSGRLEIIEDQQLLGLISQWERQLRDYTAYAERARRNIDIHLIPAIAVRGDVGPILMRKLNLQSGTSDISQSDLNDIVTIRIDDEFKTFIAERYRNSRSANEMFRRLRVIAEEVLIALEDNPSN